jgi:phosphatidylglycerophosphate synthase
LRTKITPNQITLLSVLVFFCGAGLFLTLDRTWSVLGSVSIFFSVVLDGCDGEVARFRQTRSLVGGYYVEPVSHDIQYGFMFLPLGLAAMWSTGNIWFGVLAYLAAASKLTTRLLEARHWNLRQAATVSTPGKAELKQEYPTRSTPMKSIAWVKRNTFSSNGMVLPLFIAALFAWLPWFLVVYGLGYALILCAVFVRQTRSLKHFSQTGTCGSGVPGAAE